MREWGRNRGSEQRFARLPLAAGLQRFEKADLAAFEQRDWNSVSIEHAVARETCELWTGGQDAGEVERVGAGQ